MEQRKDRLSLFQETFIGYFEKLLEILPKKEKGIRILISEVSDEINRLQVEEPNGNRFFKVFSMPFDLKSAKINEVCLLYLQKCLSYNFLNGDCEAENSGSELHLGENKLIDNIVERVLQCLNEREENVQIQIINVLLTAITNPACPLHEKSLLRAYEALVHIYLTSKHDKASMVKISAHGSLVNVTTLVFKRLDEKANELLTEGEIRRYQEMLKESEFAIERKEMNYNGALVLSDLKHSDSTENETDEPIREYIELSLNSMVNDVNLFIEREKSGVAVMPEKIKAVPFSKDLPLMQITNKIGEYSGKFGWCFVCGKSAGKYCKDTSVPLCDLECKRKHFELLNAADKLWKRKLRRTNTVQLYDALSVFKALTKIPSSDVLNPTKVKLRILLLQLLDIVFKTPAKPIVFRPEFVRIIKGDLMYELLRNAVRQESETFEPTFSIMISLALFLRAELKTEMAVFFENVLLKILESGNSSFTHRASVLITLEAILKCPSALMEFYLNFDCDVDFIDVVQQTFEIINKIIQGKYFKTQYTGILQPKQEFVLRHKCLSIIHMAVKGLMSFVESSDRIRQREKEEEEEKEDDSSETEETNQSIMEVLETLW